MATQTTTSSMNTAGGTSYAPWTQDMQKGLGGLGLGLTQNFLGNAPQFAVAGFNPDQNKGFDMLRGSALQFGEGGGGPSANTMMGGSHMNAAQLGPGDYQQFMNPFTSSVIDPALADMRRQKDQSAAEIGARAAASGSFGGSREAIQRGQLDRSLGEQTAQLVPALLSQAYNSAQGLASQNTDRQQQANQQNAGNALQAYGMENTFKNSDLDRQLASIGALLAGGQTQQNQVQKGLDVPFDMAKFLASMTPGVYNTTSWGTQEGTDTQPDNSPSTFQQLLGLGGTVLGGTSSTGGTIGGDLLSKLFG